LRMVRESGRPVTQVARELGVKVHTLRAWKRDAAAHERADQVTEGVMQPNEAEEIRRLRRELETVRQERDFLKKAAAYFAKESR
jgi:transposase